MEEPAFRGSPFGKRHAFRLAKSSIMDLKGFVSRQSAACSAFLFRPGEVCLKHMESIAFLEFAGHRAPGAGLCFYANSGKSRKESATPVLGMSDGPCHSVIGICPPTAKDRFEREAAEDALIYARKSLPASSLVRKTTAAGKSPWRVASTPFPCAFYDGLRQDASALTRCPLHIRQAHSQPPAVMLRRRISMG